MNIVLYYLSQFVIGGLMVVGITFLAKYVNPKYTGIIYALPAILIVAIIFVYLDCGLNISKSTLKSILIYEFTLVYFIFAFYLLLYKINFWWALALAFLSWSVIAFIIQLFLKS